MKNIILVGAGKWGKNYITTFKSFPEIELKIAKREDWKQLINLNPDGVIIATQPDSHIEIASYALERNIPVLIEKPLALSLQEAEKLKKFTAPIMVDYTHLYSNYYRHVLSTIRNTQLRSIVTNGYNNTPDRKYSALWDYGSHDIAIVMDLQGPYKPFQVSCKKIPSDSGEMYQIDLYFKSWIDFSAHCLVGNGGSKKARDITINMEGVTVYHDDTVVNHDPSPLHNIIDIFLKNIDGKSERWNRESLNFALTVTKILEHCEKSLNEGAIVSYK